MLSMNDIRDFRGVWVCDLFTEYIPARLVRLNRLVLTIVIHYYEYIKEDILYEMLDLYIKLD